MTRRPLGALMCVTVVAGACSGGVEWTGTLTDSAGIAIVANPSEGMWTPATRWTVEEELRIGAVEGDPDYQFGQIGGIALGSGGGIFVLDGQAQEVRVFTPDGQYQQTVGGPGQGPGELTGAMSLVMGPGDTLFVPDIQTQRINRYAPDGTALESVRLSLEDGLPAVFRATPSGVIAEQVRPLALPDRPAPDSLDAIVLLASDGSVADTLMKFPSGKTLNLGGSTPELNLYSREAVWELTPDLRLLFGVNDEYRIHVYLADGTCERILSKPFHRAPVSEQDKEAVMGFLERAWTDAGVPPAVLPQLKSIVHFGEFFPAFSNIQSGPNGTVWVQHTQSVAALSEEELEQFNLLEDSGAPDWDVFDSEGRFLGVVSMPRRFAPRLFRDNNIYGVWRDELDVQYVMRLRIVGAGGDETVASASSPGRGDRGAG
ncbi:MAG: hypothetical protein GTN62_09865 [Gemmatimonadales bacterium]|nr:hypothetical protein [Gemmatimonadales bacterium]NIN11851.1 hypothetical protein [Gemmatimonadales bacterium]NIN50401.1 hypothetical protein [Gemmatimonadales bacterium]NIP07865.1 hypothetical protein [Gemmatimonadales bacterium]NIR02070.1 hypothetical protein [Gemmatimonadales bacterium]